MRLCVGMRYKLFINKNLNNKSFKRRLMTLICDNTNQCFPKEKTISDLITRIERKQILIDPDFQRGSGVWPKVAKQRLIRSIAQGYPIPPLYLVKEGRTDTLVDGLQRTSALMDFCKGDLAVPLSFLDNTVPRLDKTMVYFKNAKCENSRELSEEDQDMFLRYSLQLMYLSGPRWNEEGYLHFFFTTINFSSDLTLGEKIWGLQHPYLIRVIKAYNESIENDTPRQPLRKMEDEVAKITQDKTIIERKKLVIFLVDIIVYSTKIIGYATQIVNEKAASEDRNVLDEISVEHETHLRQCEHAKALLDNLEEMYLSRRQKYENSLKTESPEQLMWLDEYYLNIAEALKKAHVMFASDIFSIQKYKLLVVFASLFSEKMIESTIKPVLKFIDHVKDQKIFPTRFYSDKNADFEYQLKGYIALFRFTSDSSLREITNQRQLNDAVKKIPNFDNSQKQFILNLCKSTDYSAFKILFGKNTLEDKDENVIDSTLTNNLKCRKSLPKASRVAVWDKYIGGRKRFGNCYVCSRARIEITNFHIAHVIAKNKGGGDDIANLRPTCATCNLSMGDNDLYSFRNKYFPSKNSEIVD